MALTVADLLALPVLRRGRPEVLSGEQLDHREVRWVHTSEIYEITPLLKGGELLLTTGLGLVGTSPHEQARYIDGLAGRQIAALVLELGRTFPTPPVPLVEAARQVGLPLVVLHAVVPFIEVTEAVHPLLLTGEIEMLRITERITSSLTESLLAGTGLPGLLRTIADYAGCPARLEADDGHLVAGSDQPVAGTGGAIVPAAVDLFGHRWGRLLILGPLTPLRSVLAARGAQAISLELARSGRGAPVRQQAAARLLRDIVDRRYTGADEITVRAAAVGLTVRTGERVIAIHLTIDGTAGRSSALRAVSGAADAVLSRSVVAGQDDEYSIAGVTTETDLRELLVRFADQADAALAVGGPTRVAAVTAAPATDDVAGLARSLPAAREAGRLARRLDTGIRTLLSSDLGVHRLLARLTTDPDLAEFVSEQLGPLLEYDSANGSDLVRTLEAYLGSGLSKTAAAGRLGIRRQSLYGRLQRIDGLLGGLDLASRERRTAIDLALVGWRLRSAAVISRRR